MTRLPPEFLRRIFGTKPSNLRALRRQRPLSSEPKLVLYEFESSPPCKRVREQLTLLNLKHHVRPCPRSTLLQEGVVTPAHLWRSEAEDLVTKAEEAKLLRFPILVDDGIPIFGSLAIIEHVWDNYGEAISSDEDWNLIEAKSWCNRIRTRKAKIESSAAFPLLAMVFGARVDNVLSLVTEPDFFRLLAGCVSRNAVRGAFLDPQLSLTSDKLLAIEALQDFGKTSVTLWNFEDCPASAYMRALLCSHQIPFLSVPCAMNSSHLDDMDVKGALALGKSTRLSKNVRRTERCFKPLLEIEMVGLDENNNLGSRIVAFLNDGLREKGMEASMKMVGLNNNE